MYVPCDIMPNEMSFIKVIASDELRDASTEPSQSAMSLTIEGFSQDGDVLFNYENKK